MAQGLAIVRDGEFEAKVLEAERLVLVEFGAAWCAPCKQLEPILAELGRELAGKVDIYTMDVDQDPDASVRYGVRGVPTVLIFKNGEAVERLVGLRPKKQLLAALAPLVSPASVDKEL
jgi:thioredoxin 1